MYYLHIHSVETTVQSLLADALISAADIAMNLMSFSSPGPARCCCKTKYRPPHLPNSFTWILSMCPLKRSDKEDLNRIVYCRRQSRHNGTAAIANYLSISKEKLVRDQISKDSFKNFQNI